MTGHNYISVNIRDVLKLGSKGFTSTHEVSVLGGWGKESFSSAPSKTIHSETKYKYIKCSTSIESKRMILSLECSYFVFRLELP